MKEEILPSDVRTHVREHYHALAAAPQTSCCGPSCGCGTESDRPGSELYSLEELNSLPPEVAALSLGCGNPVAIAELEPGQTVVDLGSGGGIDCFLAAGKVGGAGRVIGVDMTPSMIDAARQNNERLGATNVEFRLGEIEHLPLGDRSADVVISNCVINLSPDKAAVLGEIYRVLRPGGKLAVSDILASGPIPQELQNDPENWASCLAGAIETGQFRDLLLQAGLEDVEIRRVDSEGEEKRSGPDVLPVYQAYITARRPRQTNS